MIQGPQIPRWLRRWTSHGGGLAVALAVGATLIAIAAPTASALPALRAEPAATGATGKLATRPASAELTTQANIPGLGSRAARRIGGPLMASSGVVVNQPSDDARPLPDIPASAWVVANADTGEVLAAKDPHGEFGPASTLKVLTAVTLIPLLNPDAMVVATPLATSQQPTSAFLITGREYRVADLFRALLLISANDAAVALTQATGSFAKGMALINGEARHLQAYDVDAKLPNGLPAAGQVTSAYDEALIARQALTMPAFMKYDSTREARLELKPRDWRDPGQPELPADAVPRRHRRQDRLDREFRGHLRRAGQAQWRHAYRHRAALHLAAGDHFRRAIAELGICHERQGPAGRRAGPAAARASGQQPARRPERCQAEDRRADHPATGSWRYRRRLRARSRWRGRGRTRTRRPDPDTPPSTGRTAPAAVTRRAGAARQTRTRT